ncbi:PilW family protein [Larsenimonas salina]|uniref:PilW family protein n=1 Tax=Larsenimonas salina TaxID=1295565 RepID=UPI0020734982|nr:PilW family protein [Larsenimonas salina]MCM5705526.1 PilW family protein [Larsenimonas salina]
MSRQRQQGAGLIELMIALLIGSVLTTALIGFYLQSARDFRYQQAVTQVQETGRFTTHFLADQLKRAGFWGFAWEASFEGSFTSADDQLIDEARAGYSDRLGPLPIWSGPSPCKSPGCALVPTNYRASSAAPASDALMLRYADTSDAGGATLHLASKGACLQLSLNEVNDCGAVNGAKPRELWSYRALAFAVRQICEDGQGRRTACTGAFETARPALYMGVLTESTYRMTEVAPGVELLRLEWGLDTNADGRPDRVATGALSSEQARQAVSATLFVVVQSAPLDRSLLRAQPTLRLGEVFYAPPEDSRVRRVFSTTVALGNVQSRRAFGEVAP